MHLRLDRFPGFLFSHKNNYATGKASDESTEVVIERGGGGGITDTIEEMLILILMSITILSCSFESKSLRVCLE